MSIKNQRLVGVLLSSAICIFLFWHVDYLYGTGNFYSANALDYLSLHVVGFSDNPFGYGSIAYRIILDKFIDTSWRNSAINNAWALTQAIPIALAWGLRSPLGRFVNLPLALGSKTV